MRTALVMFAFVVAAPATAQPVAPAPRVAVEKPFSAEKKRITYPKTNIPMLEMSDGRKKPVYSLLNVQRQMRYGEHIWDEDGVPAGKTWIMIDLPRQTLSVFRAGREIGSTVILFGADSKPTPSGVFPVLAKAKKHRSNLYDAEMPFMLRLTWDGIAIHASNVRGGSATQGCIGVPPDFAELLFKEVKIGDQVSITTS